MGFGGYGKLGKRYIVHGATTEHTFISGNFKLSRNQEIVGVEQGKMGVIRVNKGGNRTKHNCTITSHK